MRHDLIEIVLLALVAVVPCYIALHVMGVVP